MNARTRFVPGQSGNLAGRTPDYFKRARKLIYPHIAQLVEQRLAAALQGDAQAADSVLAFYAATTPKTP